MPTRDDLTIHDLYNNITLAQAKPDARQKVKALIAEALGKARQRGWEEGMADGIAQATPPSTDFLPDGHIHLVIWQERDSDAHR